MQNQNVQTTIPPLVSGLLTERRALEKLEAQEIAAHHSLKKRLESVIKCLFRKVCEEAASQSVSAHAAWSIRNLESIGTGLLRLSLDLNFPKALSHEQTALLRTLYFKFKKVCLATFTSVNNLTFEFKESSK